VVLLRFVDGLSAREIGTVLGRSEGSVRVLQHRALRELSGILGPED
jgi:RNA polymerase sigma-70 factor (ECF subfamily)